ncbi:MAG: formyltransferase family protein [Planctomycetota bacterium]
MTARLAILLSGSGRTLLNIHAHQQDLDATITRVIASRECLGVERACDLKLPTQVIPGEIAAAQLESIAAHADLLILAGYLRRIHVPPSLADRILNIHPAPLSIRDADGSPRFGGRGMWGHHVHNAVLEAFRAGDMPHSGCTVHVVDDEYDHGPTILERHCPILPTDTPDALAARVFELEQEAYPEAIALHLATLGRESR